MTYSTRTFPMWIAAAILTFAATFAGALVAVHVVRRRPLALEALLAFALTVVIEALVLNVLSVFRAVTRPGVLAAHGVVIACLAVVVARAAPTASLAAARRRVRASLSAIGPPALLVVPILVLVAISALRFAPNNWDSMTYHLARVAHWIQQRSVGVYPTHVDRQLLLMPGAEYVLATLQVLSGTDRLANFVQLAAWVLVVLASAPLARLAGAPRRLAPWAAVFAASLPMGVLQASSTQNDLVAAALALGAWVACTPFLKRRPGAWTACDAVVLAAVLAGASIVKASALVVAAPVVAVAITNAVRSAVRGGARKVAAAVVAAVVVVGIVVGPEIARRREAELSRAMKEYAASYMYPATGELSDRALNLARGVVRHVPLPRDVVSASGVDPVRWCLDGDALCGGVLLRAHEDFAGNPVHVALAVVAAIVVAIRWRRLPRRGRLLLAAAATAWLLFHATFRDNAWISRLETPTFALAGVAVAALAGMTRRQLRWATLGTAVVALGAVAHGTAVAAQNETRPPFLSVPEEDRDLTYYANQPTTSQVHDTVLRAAQQLRCDRLGIVIGGDSYDYPLTWRAMQAGVAVRHVFGADPWPCLIFAEQAPAPLEALRWQRTSVPFLFLNAAATASR